MGISKKVRRERSSRGKRKGSLEETISYAFYKDDPTSYTVFYRDKEKIKEASLKDFVEGEVFSPIPLTRIVQITRNEKDLVWKKGQKELSVKQTKA